MVSVRLLSLVESILGTGINTKDDNYKFYSPFINHTKPKLEINMNIEVGGLNKWHCWVSDERGQTLYSLFKQLALKTNLISDNHFKQLAEIFNDLPIEFKKPSTRYKELNDTIPTIQLPPNTNTIWNGFSTFKAKLGDETNYKLMVKYLIEQRNITLQDVIKYNLMYNMDRNNKYYNTIIIPSYNKYNKLNFYVTHHWSQSYYIKPSFTQTVFFDNMIEYKQPIKLVEGVYDAITLGDNTIPLLGKNITNDLLLKIVEHNTPQVDIYLDQEKEARLKSLSIAKRLKRFGVPIVNIHLWKEEYGDVNDMGLELLKEKSILIEINSFNSNITYKQLLRKL